MCSVKIVVVLNPQYNCSCLKPTTKMKEDYEFKIVH